MRKYLLSQPHIDTSAYLANSSIIIGDVTVGVDSSVWPQAVLRGDMEKIVIGNKTNIQDATIIHTTHGSTFHAAAPVTIGNNVTIGHACVIHGCTIGDLCLIGIRTTILDHAIIENYTLIGANSLVPPGKVLTGGYLWLGTPVRKIRALTENEIAFFSYSADDYVRLKNYYQERHMS